MRDRCPTPIWAEYYAVAPGLQPQSRYVLPTAGLIHPSSLVFAARLQPLTVLAVDYSEHRTFLLPLPQLVAAIGLEHPSGAVVARRRHPPSVGTERDGINR